MEEAGKTLAGASRYIPAIGMVVTRTTIASVDVSNTPRRRQRRRRCRRERRPPGRVLPLVAAMRRSYELRRETRRQDVDARTNLDVVEQVNERATVAAALSRALPRFRRIRVAVTLCSRRTRRSLVRRTRLRLATRNRETRRRAARHDATRHVHPGSHLLPCDGSTEIKGIRTRTQHGSRPRPADELTLGGSCGADERVVSTRRVRRICQRVMTKIFWIFLT